MCNFFHELIRRLYLCAAPRTREISLPDLEGILESVPSRPSGHQNYTADAMITWDYAMFCDHIE
jgi:hypothetical protein